MANIMRRGRPSIFNLRRDVDDVLDEFMSPRGLRREIDRLWAEDLAPRSLWQELDRLFEDFVSPTPLRRRVGALFEPFGVGIAPLGLGRGGAMFIPDIELIERDSEYLVKVDVPGVRREDLDVSIDDRNMLTVRGERREEQTGERRGYEYTERSYGSFERSVELPRAIDTANVEAEFRDGVLQLHIPKTAQAAARKIPIRIGVGVQGGELGQGRAQPRGASAEQPRVVSPSDQGAERRDTRTQANAR